MEKVCNIIMILMAILGTIFVVLGNKIVFFICITAIIIVLLYLKLKGRLIIKESSKENNIYKMALSSLNVVVWEWSEEKNNFLVSGNIKKILNCEDDINSLEDMYEYLLEEDKDYIISFFEDMINGRVEESFSLDFTIITAKNEAKTMECTGKGEIKDNVYRMSGVMIDNTEKTKQDQLLRESERNYRRALDGSQDIMFYINLETKNINLNGRIAYLLELEQKNEFNFSMDEWFNFIHEEDKQGFVDYYRDFINSRTPFFSFEYRVVTASGRILWFKIRGKRILEEDGEYIYGSINNDTDRKEKELKIHYMSNYDEVTGVPNRRYFVGKAYDMLKKSIENGNNFAMIFIDLDNFKIVNDTYGHNTGDNLLGTFCKKLSKFMKDNCLLARFGGDEFVIAIENVIRNEEVIEIVEKIVNAFNSPFLINGKEIYNTVSIGISITDGEGDNIQTLLKKSDMAMYNAKTSGKNRYFLFNKDLSEKLNHELTLTSYLRKAVDTDEVYFQLQPKYYGKTAKIQGFECLARWKNKDLGFISPADFIPLAERTGLIIPIGKCLIEEGFQKIKKLTEKIDSDFKVAINLSEVQIRDESLFSFIRDKIREYEIDPKYIEFEVTESIIMKSVDKNIRVLDKLKSLGVSIALDDFGTGYSSLNYLKILPIDTVKIDKSFVKDIGKDYKDECIIEKIVELSHLLDLKVVAEGVEDKYQLDYLNRIECDIIQGYYFSKPREFDDILENLL